MSRETTFKLLLALIAIAGVISLYAGVWDQAAPQANETGMMRALLAGRSDPGGRPNARPAPTTSVPGRGGVSPPNPVVAHRDAPGEGVINVAPTRSASLKDTGHLSLQVGAYREGQYLQRLISRLKEGGFPVWSDRGPRLHIVFVGPFSSAQKVKAAQDKLTALGLTETYLVSKVPSSEFRIPGRGGVSPPSAASPLSESSPGYLLQAGAYHNPDNAAQIQKKLQSLGYGAWTAKNEQFTTVFAGRFQTREAAERSRDQLAAHGVTVFLIGKP